MFKRLLLALNAIALSVGTLRAGDTFAGPGTTGTTLSYYVVSAAGNGVPRVQYINATSDKSTSVLKFYTPSVTRLITATGASGQAVITADSTGFAVSDVCVVRHVATDTYERLVISATNSTTITFTANLAASVAAGDYVNKMAAKGTIPVGATTKEINAAHGGVFNGASGKSVLIDLDGTSACSINVAAGVYEKP